MYTCGLPRWWFVDRCQEYFVRKANKSLQASTHLIVREPEGSKYNAAKKWNIPAVAKE